MSESGGTSPGVPPDGYISASFISSFLSSKFNTIHLHLLLPHLLLPRSKLSAKSTMAQAPTVNISEGHLVLIRHAEAISNVIGPDDGLDARTMTFSDLKELAVELQNSAHLKSEIRYGTYLPDGLTQTGLEQVQSFVNEVTGEGQRKIDNVYMVGASPLTRACQTIMGILPAFDLVGPMRSTGQNARSRIYCHPGGEEATPWPQDFPSKRDDKGIASYLKVKGGKEADCGKILGEEKVDLSGTTWPPSEENKYLTDNDLMTALSVVPTAQQIEEATKRCRLWLRECMATIIEEHQRQNREGPPRIIFATHGGIRHFLTKRWYCDFRKDESGNWRWKGSSALKNMEVNVLTFTSLSDSEADLEELEWDPSYRDMFGKYYRHMGSDQSLIYIQPDGTIVDQKSEHMKFIERISGEVRATVLEQEPVVRALLGWKGASQFLEEN